MLLSNRDISEEERHGAIVIQPYRAELLQPSSLDVVLSAEFKVQRQLPADIFVDPRLDNSGMFETVTVPKGEEFVIYPGDFVLGSTFEVVALGANFAARIEGKSSLGRLGLVVHSTAGFIDPGFDGQITLELSNMGTTPIVLIPGMKIAQLCFFKLPEPSTILYGSRFAGSHYQNQSGPTCSRSFQNFKVYDVYGEVDTTKKVG
jgi:dCTP deaminase